MLQLFHLGVAKVDRGMLHMLHMLQIFQKHVASVCSKYFLCFHTYVAIVFDKDITYVATVCFKCLNCFSLMLQQVVSCCKLQVFFYVS
jgi:hypothetical protein